MAPKLSKFSKNGTMDKFVTKHQTGESSPSPNLKSRPKTSPRCDTPFAKGEPRSAPGPCRPLFKQDEEEEEQHATHSFEWACDNKNPTTITCNKAGTVEDVLKRSQQFREIAEKNKNKELVVVRDGKAINSRFPCSLIKNDRLNVKYFKAVDKPMQLADNRTLVSPKRKRPSDQIVMFHVLTNGGRNIKRIMRNPALRSKIEEITVHAYKGENVKHALRRDGRFLNTIFKKNCVLSHTSTEVTTEMSSLVDDLDGKTFKIKLLNKSSLPDSQSLDDAYVMQNEPQASDSNENQDPPQQSTAQSTTEWPEKTSFEIPDSKELQCQLLSQFKDLVKGMRTQVPRFSRVQNLFRAEYGKSDQTCREVKTMKKLMDLSNSVGQVRINGSPAGSGFLLFDRFVLTNGHVIKTIYNESMGQLLEKVTVHFSYESLDQVESAVEVENVAGFEYCTDESGHKIDWALLRLSADQKLPDGLLTHFGFIPPSGGICIIGHPDGSVKRIDPCVIISSDNRTQVVERHYHENPGLIEVEGGQYSEGLGHIQLVTPKFFEDVAKDVEHNRKILTYETCFYYGSSGSPVFDEHCNVIAMHSAGYPYRNARGQNHSVIEYGYPLSIIVEHIVVQVVERGRFDVLKEYLACGYTHQHNVLLGLKRLVESRNLPAFKNALDNPVVATDESLKAFFEFLSHKEAPEPMDTD